MNPRFPKTGGVGLADARQLHLLGVSFRTSSLELRDGLSFGPAQTAEVLRAAAASGVVPEAVILSTCNRTEFYLAASDPDVVTAWIDWLARWRPGSLLAAAVQYGYARVGDAAAVHLLRVACGLESAVLGDVQIQGQVRAAMQVAADAGTLGDTLQQAFAGALRAGRRARAETAIARGAPTIGSALAGILETRLTARSEGPPTVVVVGAGKVARTVGRHLAKRRFARLVFVNRTRAGAEQLAARCGGQIADWSALEPVLARADAVIAATAAGYPILTRATLERVAAGRTRPLLVIDAGVPRNVQPCDAVELLDIDAAREHQARDLGARQAAVPAVERIVDVELTRWREWRARQPVEALIGSLYRHAAALSRSEAGRLESLPRADAERALFAAFKHLLHDHVRRLRALGVPT